MIAKSVSLGPLTFHLYGLIIAMAIFVGWYIAKKRAHLYKIHQNLFDDPILLIPLVLSIGLARAYHVLDYWSFYSTDPTQILNIANGGLGIWGAIGGIVLGFWIVSKLKKVSFFSILDLASPSLLLGQAIGRIGNYINMEGFGPPTSLPWGVFVSPESRPQMYLKSSHFHPTFFYEAILNMIFFSILIYLSYRFKKPGQIFAFYLIFYATSRFIVEFARIDTATVGTVKIAHLLSVLVFILGLFILAKAKKLQD